MNKQELHDFIARQQPNICQMVAVKDGETVYSDTWNDYTKDDCVHVMSVTKSIMALLIGIAIDKGQIHSVDDKVLDYFPEYKVKRGEKTIYEVTIRHLITMRAPYKGKGDPWSKVYIKNLRMRELLMIETIIIKNSLISTVCTLKILSFSNS